MIDWALVNSRLPHQRTPEQRAARKELWARIDVNGNGHLSLAEITKVPMEQAFFSKIV